MVMNKGKADRAVRRASAILDEWIRVTGVVEEHTSYHSELEGIIEDAVHCGIQAALDTHKYLDSEKHAILMAAEEIQRKDRMEGDRETN